MINILLIEVGRANLWASLFLSWDTEPCKWRKGAVLPYGPLLALSPGTSGSYYSLDILQNHQLSVGLKLEPEKEKHTLFFLKDTLVRAFHQSNRKKELKPSLRVFSLVCALPQPLSWVWRVTIFPWNLPLTRLNLLSSFKLDCGR